MPKIVLYWIIKLRRKARRPGREYSGHQTEEKEIKIRYTTKSDTREKVWKIFTKNMPNWRKFSSIVGPNLIFKLKKGPEDRKK